LYSADAADIERKSRYRLIKSVSGSAAGITEEERPCPGDFDNELPDVLPFSAIPPEREIDFSRAEEDE
jgi:hypothetical protein